MERHPKFVVTENNNNDKLQLLFGYCFYHSDLVSIDTEHCIGGGWYTIDKNTRTIVLYGSSDDFGPVMPHELIEAFKNSTRTTKLHLPIIFKNRFDYVFDKETYKFVFVNDGKISEIGQIKF